MTLLETNSTAQTSGTASPADPYGLKPAQVAAQWIREWKATYGRWPTKGRWPGRAAGFSLGTYRAVLAVLKRLDAPEEA